MLVIRQGVTTAFVFLAIATSQAVAKPVSLQNSAPDTESKVMVNVPLCSVLSSLKTAIPDTEKLLLQERQVNAAEKAANAAENNENIAKNQVAWTHWGFLLTSLALLGPYGVILFQRKLTTRKAKKTAEVVFDASAKACTEACTNNMGKTGRCDQDIWLDLTELSAIRNILDTQIKESSVGANCLLGLSQNLQINYVVTYALEMRQSTQKTQDFSLSDSVLQSINYRLNQAKIQFDRPDYSMLDTILYYLRGRWICEAICKRICKT